MGDREIETLAGAAVVFTNDDVLRHVDQTTGEVARVGCAQCGVGEALASTVGGNEVLGHRQALAVRVDDRSRDDLTARVRHQAAHTGDVADLQPVASSARGHHAVDRVVDREVCPHLVVDRLSALGPQLDELATTLVVGREALVELGLNLRGLLLVLRDDLLLLRRGDDVAQRHRDTRAGGPVEAGVFHLVECRGDDRLRVPLGQVVDDLRDGALVGHVVDERVVRRQQLVEQRATQRGLAQLATVGELLAEQTDARGSVEVQRTLIHGHDRLRDRRERPAFARSAFAHGREVVQTDDHVLRGNRHRAAV